MARFDGSLPSRNRSVLKSRKQFAGVLKIRVGTKALQHFSENKVADQKSLSSQQVIEDISFGASAAVEIVNPDGGIYKGHGVCLVVTAQLVEIAFPLQLAAVAPNSLLLLLSNEHAETAFHRLPLGCGARSTHSGLHQFIVNDDISAHMCMGEDIIHTGGRLAWDPNAGAARHQRAAPFFLFGAFVPLVVSSAPLNPRELARVGGHRFEIVFAVGLELFCFEAAFGVDREHFLVAAVV